MPAPSVIQTKLALAELDESQSFEFRERLQRIGRGTESTQDLDQLVAWSRKAMEIVEVAPVKIVPQQFTKAPNRSAPANEDDLSGIPQVKAQYERSHHVYSGSGGMTVELRTFPPDGADARTEGAWTIQIEMAKAAGKNKFDWEHKVVFMLTKRELPLFAASLMGWLPVVEFANHGPSNDKKLVIKDQQAHLFFEMKQGKKTIQMRVGGEEMFTVTSMVIKALNMNAPHLDSQSILQMIRRIGGMYGSSIGVVA